MTDTTDTMTDTTDTMTDTVIPKIPSEPENYTPKTGFLEFGSTSIKFYIMNLSSGERDRVAREVKIPWSLGYDVFEHQRISPSTITRCLTTLEGLQREFPEIPFDAITSVGTAALREAQNYQVFQRLLLERLGLRLSIIEGGIEAFLLETGFRDSVESYPTALFDVGGGSLEFVEYLSPNSTRKTSVPLGAIRLHCRLRHTRDLMEYITEGRRIALETVREQLVPHTAGYEELIGTAGTVRAIVSLLGRDVVTGEDISRLMQREIHGEVWEELEPHRRRLLLPGLIIIESLFTTFHLARVVHKTASVKRGLATLTQLLPARQSG